MIIAPTPGPDQPPHPFAPGSIGRRLLVRVLIIVTLATTGVAALSIVVTQQLLLGQLDQQVMTLARERSVAAGSPRGISEDQKLRGQPIGTILVEPGLDGSVVVSLNTKINGSKPSKQEQLEFAYDLSALAPDSQPRSVRLSIGDYRAVAVSTPAGTLIAALPLDEINDTVFRLMVIGMVASSLAILASALAVREVMSRSLRPLNRLAGTARQVSTQELAHGEVDLTARVPPGDADPATEVGQVGQAFNRMLDNVSGALAARQASETKVRQFVADASHELRNPLAAIKGYAELTRRDRDQLPPHARHAMDRIESESERMSSLVEDLLLLARLDADPALQLGPVDASELLINAVSDARIAGTDHRWSVELSDEPVLVLGDRFRLHQVVANLLANARTHTPAGTSVVASVVARGEWAEIAVTDDGPGIPDQIRDTAFERFTRADSSRSRTGQGQSTGLGLAIVAAVMAAHGGEARVDSRPGRTSIRLRVRLAEAAPRAEVGRRG
ncbi:two-component system OmpR family sensor kinase [Naumannella cuiyingiana]|uniref:histidine kinase n=1 Tax=Naumannella cuiyingiana TaxID=1347891 RepID=A0A7Z0D8G9_9ACTN|nr:HAMP domain-containing sensor histidine kinase [Naumannella cuiyingiana]NYI70755.1 two-component system OmpR family sensor kinase [Naumannella cuiyingiana]